MATSVFQRDLRVYAASDSGSLFNNARIGFAGGQVLLVHRPTMRGLHFTQAGAAVTQLAKADVEDLLHSQQFQAKGDVYGCLGLLSLPTEDDRWIKAVVVVKECKSHGKLLNKEVFHISAVEMYFVGPMYSSVAASHARIIKRLFASGSFLFAMDHSAPSLSVAGSKRNSEPSLPRRQDEQPPPARSITWKYDLTCRIQHTLTAGAEGQEHDDRFWWSRVMWHEVQKHGINCKGWLIPVIRGSVEMRTVYVGAVQAKAALISRLSCQRAGTRFNARGIDDDGNAANFVETEQIITLDDHVVAYVMTRGSVPVFWEQATQNVGHQKPHLTREFEATKPAFERHMELLTAAYGEQTLLSLLGHKSGETLLQSNYNRHWGAFMPGDREHFHQLDVSTICKGGNKIDKLMPYLSRFDECMRHQSFLEAVDSQIVNDHKQMGSFRVNCLDCLDRSNVCQSAIGLKVLEQQLLALNERTPLRDTKMRQFERLFRDMWQRNGDNLARCVTGSGSLSGGVKTSLFKDVQRSISRTLRGNFFDRHRQAAIDVVLGTYVEDTTEQYVVPDPKLRVKLEEALAGRRSEFTTQLPARIVVGTWNVNAQKPSQDTDLSDWLLRSEDSAPPDIFAVGLQEMIDLKAKNMMARSSAIASDWSRRILSTIGSDHYFLVVKQQLVGVCLFVFARTDHKSSLRGVRTHYVKTGAGGKMGNKGGVALSLRFHSTSICFVCAHLAAGKAHIEERNQDYNDISAKLNFGKGRRLDSHDMVVWLGDFNYRIEGSKDIVRGTCEAEHWRDLLCKDQLTISKSEGHVFHGFEEPLISFRPTYKYDIGTDTFDTSEKQRAPAWTDRVLFRGRGLECELYDCANSLKMSDHRPVTCVLKATVTVVDEMVQSDIREEIMSDLRRQLASVVIICPSALLSATELAEVLGDYGQLSFIDRVKGAPAMIATFESSEVAKKITKFHGKELLGEKVYVYVVGGEEEVRELVKQHYKRSLADLEDLLLLDDDEEEEEEVGGEGTTAEEHDGDEDRHVGADYSDIEDDEDGADSVTHTDSRGASVADHTPSSDTKAKVMTPPPRPPPVKQPPAKGDPQQQQPGAPRQPPRPPPPTAGLNGVATADGEATQERVPALGAGKVVSDLMQEIGACVELRAGDMARQRRSGRVSSRVSTGSSGTDSTWRESRASRDSQPLPAQHIEDVEGTASKAPEHGGQGPAEPSRSQPRPRPVAPPRRKPSSTS